MRATVLYSLLMICVLGVSAGSADELEGWLRDATSPVLHTRLQALRALGDSGDIRAVRPLLIALQDDNVTIRDCAAAALRSLVRAIQGLYATVAQWIEELLATLEQSTTAPPPPVEKTWHLRHI